MSGGTTSFNKENYPFLFDQPTIDFIKKSQTLFIIRGQPGNETSTLAKEIEKLYKNDTATCPAAKYPPEIKETADKPEQEVEQQKHDNCIEEACKGQKRVVIVDNSGAEKSELENYTEIVKKYNYIEVLTGGDEQYEIVYPIFYGWYQKQDYSSSLRKFATDIYSEMLNNVQFVEEFRKYLLPGAKPDEDLTKYFTTEEFDVGPLMLHCTAFYSNFGEVNGSKEYATRKAVKNGLGKVYSLNLIGFIITPKTFGFRLQLNKEDLLLWDATDTEIDPKWRPSQYNPTAGNGSQAHMSIGCGPGIEPVQTGIDLDKIIKKELEDVRNSSGDTRLTIDLSEGHARCYDDGYWGIYLKENKKIKALFSGFY